MKKFVIGIISIGFSAAYAQSNVVFESQLPNAYASTPVNVYKAAAGDFWGAVKRDDGPYMRVVLKSGFDPNVRDDKGLTGLLISLREESYSVADALIDDPRTHIEVRTPADESPLMLAALRGQTKLVKKLIARDADVNKKGWTPLHYAATKGQTEVVRELLEHSAYIDAPSPNGTTPLMMAAQYGSIDAVKLLLEEGADASLVNQQGQTALDFAHRADKDEVIQMISAKLRPQRDARLSPANRPTTPGAAPAQPAAKPLSGGAW